MSVGFGTDILANLASGKPNIPAFNPINIDAELGKSTTANLSGLPGLENLASQTNTFNTAQLNQILASVIPGYNAMTESAGKDITAELSGQLPKDVSDLVQNSAAAKAISGGFGGTGMHGDLVARDLGLTSLDLTQKGISTAQSWISSMAKISTPEMFNFSSMFITPQQQFSADVEERNAQFQHDYVSNMNDYQHAFGTAVGQDIQDTGNTVMSLLSSFMGGAAGGAKG